MNTYLYRAIEHPDDLRPGERLLQLTHPSLAQCWQGDRPLLPKNVTKFYAERAVPFRSRLRTR